MKALDLKNGEITVGEVLRSPEAKRVLEKHFPVLAGNRLMLSMAKGWSLNQVLQKVSGKVDPQRIARVRAELEKLP